MEACYIGTNATATVTSTGQGLQIPELSGQHGRRNDGGRRNVISGSTGTGITRSAAHNTVIRGNLIGTGPTGDTDLGNVTGISLVNPTTSSSEARSREWGT